MMPASRATHHHSVAVYRFTIVSCARFQHHSHFSPDRYFGSSQKLDSALANADITRSERQLGMARMNHDWLKIHPMLKRACAHMIDSC